MQSPQTEPPDRPGIDVAALREAARTGPAASRRMLTVSLGVGLGAAVGCALAWAALTSASGPAELAPRPRTGAATSAAATTSSTPCARPRPSLEAPLPDGHSSITSQPAVAQGHADWLPVLSALDRNRSRAFATGGVAAPGKVYAPGSAALNVDRRRLSALRSAGLFPRGLRPSRAMVRPIRADVGSVVLEVCDRLPPYTIVDHVGDAVELRPGRSEQTWHVTIVPVPGSPGQWFISSIRLAA